MASVHSPSLQGVVRRATFDQTHSRSKQKDVERKAVVCSFRIPSLCYYYYFGQLLLLLLSVALLLSFEVLHLLSFFSSCVACPFLSGSSDFFFILANATLGLSFDVLIRSCLFSPSVGVRIEGDLDKLAE